MRLRFVDWALLSTGLILKVAAIKQAAVLVETPLFPVPWEA